MRQPTLLRKSLLLSFVCLLLASQSQAFVGPSPSHQALRSASPLSTTALAAEARPRRAIFSWVRKAFFAAAGASTLSSLVEAKAEDLTGPIVEFEVANLDGDPSHTGKVKIQLQPEWAPKGVDRFMVCSC